MECIVQQVLMHQLHYSAYCNGVCVQQVLMHQLHYSAYCNGVHCATGAHAPTAL